MKKFRPIKLSPEQIEDWVARHFDYKKRRGGEELLINNPFIPGDSGFKFNISMYPKENKHKTTGHWVHDWRPSASMYNGSFIKFVMNYRGLDFRSALKEVCGDDIDLKALSRPYRKKKEEIEEEEEPEIIMELPKLAVPIDNDKWPRLRKIALHYLAGRGITEKDAKAYKLHYTPTMIIFPYLEYGMIVYWQGRTFSKSVKQFEFPSYSNKSDFIYGFDYAEPGHPVFITEAIIDSMTLGPGGLGTGGASIIENQKRKIRAIGPSIVVLAPDNDQEGYSSLYKNYQLLRPYHKVHYVLPPDPYKDWNQMACGDKELDGIGIPKVRQYAQSNFKPVTTSVAIKYRKMATKLKGIKTPGLIAPGDLY